MKVQVIQTDSKQYSLVVSTIGLHLKEISVIVWMQVCVCVCVCFIFQM